ncbi:hypothetical protein LEP1GSC016_2563 [Leptospira borgpetersenii serovar Hardjo-bovis str. Sponselee]|uniref:Uncharacterized protein n=1 Tax=Leptospira borgpetersenii serovar Hardjo-bovis str. Sponselee TaxID=1303729 RepID=M6BJN1_LEPBO|nr:hypothetical protein LBK6_07605 [Leptospira borgpetersenii serovar Hardjo]AWV70077.1 hypothetical protein B9T54_08320 [Leptospira borgpetersenii serovar Hardjo-bovis]EMJ78766.1 hypothetical protein LEP1GSC016_2563 [Leptospira borgpetersenii serovar Hardjo-bovis str. Sponselee]TQE50879.1 hypothetical protein FFZ95_16775 [Leptospira borgpetersenii]AMX61464.1 hypothetical protein LBK9_07615 [Leptospira borgpetersenii serovar Hardjo]
MLGRRGYGIFLWFSKKNGMRLLHRIQETEKILFAHIRQNGAPSGLEKRGLDAFNTNWMQ